jgi:regulator of protease activity HflC (stomatin/prohibitin superfamily)
VFPLLDRIVRVSLRTVAIEIPVQELVTKDNVTVRVNGVSVSGRRSAGGCGR